MSTQADPLVPPFHAYIAPIVAALRDAAGPLPNDALNRAVAKRMQLSEAVLAVPHDPERSDQPEAFYRMAWARTYLKKAGLLDNAVRGAWALTASGRSGGPIDPDEVVRKVRGGVEADPASLEVPDHVMEELLGIHRAVQAEGRLPEGEALAACYRRFRERFGPDVLKRLDGLELLTAVHGRGESRDSLVYWLEFKNDDELPGIFGSIAGGSALKFGIYQSNETGEWITGSGRAQRRLSVEEAIELVRTQRDQLIAAGEYVLALAPSPEKIDYSDLERKLHALAPDLADAGWGHKYLAMLAPAVLDDYHALFYQDFHLVKLHKLPTGLRYENARFFAAIARQLQMPMVHLGAVLNRRHGSPHPYWRVGTRPEESKPSEWPRMREGGFIAIGWSELGSLHDIEHSKSGKDLVRSRAQVHFPKTTAGVITRSAGELFQFATGLNRGDIVVAMQGMTALGIGQVTGDYYYEPGDGPFAHRRQVVWKSLEEWKFAEPDGLLTTFKRLKRPINLIAIERRLSLPGIEPAPTERTSRRPGAVATHQPLTGVAARIEDALRRKGQVVLYGPPGTGKTHWALSTLRELAARTWFDANFESLTEPQKADLLAHGAIEQCCFHPAYGYEDFLVGYRPFVRNALLAYEATPGVFARLCARALSNPQRHYYLLIDEINRGDIPRIFGELLMVLEKDKRGLSVTVPLLEKALVVPTNLFLVGTMNTADRSVALLDAALRRRFAFIELMPDTSTLDMVNVAGLPLGPWLSELNRRVVQFAGRDARNLQIGHAYLFHAGEPVRHVDRFAEVLRDDIIPLLQEYCYEDFGALERILGSTLIQGQRQQIDYALFEPTRRVDLIEALLAAFPEITATRAAAKADAEYGPEDDDADGEEPERGEVPVA